MVSGVVSWIYLDKGLCLTKLKL